VKTKQIEKIAKKISNRWGMPEPVVENKIGKCGDKQVEIRSELTLGEGGIELQDTISKLDNSYICEAEGGCVYTVYQPK